MQAVAHADGAGAEHQQYLTFRLGEETFAMPILMIKEILEYPELTSVCPRGVEPSRAGGAGGRSGDTVWSSAEPSNAPLVCGDSRSVGGWRTA